ncbi:MAG TPA: Uma2 family endonuclease [Ktedonobacteraceae bacterium]|jgi:Uma2 family endonuclease|nr:Uma2 family endonuclease [Ktedonobacteraceae bacterium]
MAADKSAIHDGLYMTEEQYLTLDEATDGNYEFYDGYVVMLRPPSSAYDERAIIDMAGGSLAHAALCARLGGLLDYALTDSSCIVYNSDVKLKIGSSRHYFHPDVSVSGDEQKGKMLTDPVVVIEVLSPATEKRDRGAKLATYKTLPSLMEYLLVGSQMKEIVIYRRENSWMPYHYQSGDLVELKSIGVSFPFDAVYRRITLE